MSADAVMPVGVVVERRTAENKWVAGDLWRPIGVLPHAGLAPGRLLAEGEGWSHYWGGVLNIELYRGETDGYQTNLSQDQALVYVVLRRRAEAGVLEFEPFLATVCPYEAMNYAGGNDDDIVEGVPMPPEMVAWLTEFVALYHVDRPFKKRKNEPQKDGARGKAPPRAQLKGVRS